MISIRSIDFETTGIPTETDKQAIVEIGWCDIVGGQISGVPRSVLCNPGRKIPHEAMAVHHITDAMVAEATSDLGVLLTDPRPDYFCAHNADYERQFVETDTPFICTYKVALRLWSEAPSHGLQFLRYYLGLEAVADLASPPHRAGPDAYLGALLMARILDEDQASIEDMVRWSNGHALLPRCPLFKHKGKEWKDVPTEYLDWIVNKPNEVGPDVRANARLHLKARAQKFPQSDDAYLRDQGDR